jgi:hypothetical protein
MTAVASVIAVVTMTVEAEEETVTVVVPVEVRKTVGGARHLGMQCYDRFGGIKIFASVETTRAIH